MKQASRNLALCGVLCALAVAIMAMGTILPVATYCAPVLASMTLLPVLVLCGEKLSWAMFFASAMLSLLLAPDKEAAAIFLALGYYRSSSPSWTESRKSGAGSGNFCSLTSRFSRFMRCFCSCCGSMRCARNFPRYRARCLPACCSAATSCSGWTTGCSGALRRGRLRSARAGRKNTDKQSSGTSGMIRKSNPS